MRVVAKAHKGLKSLQVLQHRKLSSNSTEQLKQKKLELAVKTELMHKLSVQLQSYDAVEFEVREDIIPIFLVILEDPALAALYDFEQVSDSLYVFHSKEII